MERPDAKAPGILFRSLPQAPLSKTAARDDPAGVDFSAWHVPVSALAAGAPAVAGYGLAGAPGAVRGAGIGLGAVGAREALIRLLGGEEAGPWAQAAAAAGGGLGGLVLADPIAQAMEERHREPKQAGILDGIPDPPPVADSAILQLLRAKAESDRRNYRKKHEIIRSIMLSDPAAFSIDSQQDGIVGLTHRNGFRIHVPEHIVPPSQVKTAAATMADVFRPLYSAWQLTPNSLNQHVGGPTPLASMAAGGLIGAGGGYLGGRLAEAILPEQYFERGKLSRTTALLGGLLGAAPGAIVGHNNMQNRSLEGRNPWSGWVEPNDLFGHALPPGHEVSASLRETSQAMTEELEELGLTDEGMAKQSDFTGATFYMPDIPVDKFGREIWNDANTPPGVASTATSLLQAADESRGGYGLVSPADIARIAMGAGSGLVSATIVGKVLGAISGLTPYAQKQLQQAGLWAGILSNVVPMSFGNR